MSDVTTLHRTAMELAERAFAAQERHLTREAVELFSDALDAERKAAELAAVERLEPSRSVLFRSAAWLAYHAGLEREALRLVAAGLTPTTPPQIAEELRELQTLIRVYTRLVPEFPLRPEFHSVVNQVLEQMDFESQLLSALIPREHPHRAMIDHPVMGEHLRRSIGTAITPNVASFLASPREGVPRWVYGRPPLHRRDMPIRPELSAFLRRVVVKVAHAQRKSVSRHEVRARTRRLEVLMLEILRRYTPELSRLLTKP